MFKRIKEFFTGKPEVKAVEVIAEAPYKVETVADQATQAVVESLVPAKKPQAKKPAGVKKVAATKPKQPKQRKPKVTK
jgi:hypothetical protein